MTLIAPGLYLRQSCVKDMTGSLPPGDFLEVGAGVGMMTRRFLERGFRGCCYDLSSESRNIIKRELGGYGDHLEVLDNLSDIEDRRFVYLFAFEVLEHIEDDRQALVEWSRYLVPGGTLVVSVPAHQSKFSRADEWVGHVRRYERADLRSLLKHVGFEQIEMVNYGFPLTALSGFVSSRLLKRYEPRIAGPAADRTLQSSYTRPSIINRVLALVHVRMYEPFRLLQRLFYRNDWGSGIVVVARKSEI